MSAALPFTICCPPLPVALPSLLSPIVIIVVVVVVVAGCCLVVGDDGWCWWWCIVVVVGHAGGWLNKLNMGSSLGDVAHHMINVGTCCPNLHNYMWAGGSTVKQTLL